MDGLYFDCSATTPIDPQVMAEMQPYFRERFGNSASGLHQFGWDAEKAVENARKKIAHVLKAAPFELYFTSGATESNNWALRGVIESFLLESPATPVHVLASAIEHKSVLACLQQLQKLLGSRLELEILPVNKLGLVSLEDLKQRKKSNTRLISVMWVNNEIGTIQPISAIGKWAHENQIYFHTDATQAMGKVPVDLQTVHVDLLSLSAHKVYGPKGSGILYIRSREPKVRLQPLLMGGGHERGQRSGTLNVPGIVGLAKALELMSERFAVDLSTLKARREEFFQGLKKRGIAFQLNGDPQGASSIANLTFPQAGANMSLPGVAFSKGSACHSDKVETSHVLAAIGVTGPTSERTFRFSWGRETTLTDVERLLEVLQTQLVRGA